MLIHHIIYVLLMGVVVFATAKLVPGITVKSYGSAVAVAVVYALLNFVARWLLFQTPLALLGLPLLILTFGLILFVLNMFILKVTDKLMESFEVKGTGALIVGTGLITVGNWAASAIAY